VMRKGQIVERGATTEIFRNPQHPYTKALIAAEPKGSAAPARTDAPVVMEAKDLKIWFPIRRGIFKRTVGHIKAVDGISLQLKAGETIGVVGESGSGKTTLGQAILRLIGSEGEISVLGNRIDGASAKALRPLRKDMQIVFQDPFGSLSPRMSVAEIIAEGLYVQNPKLPNVEARAKVAAAMAEVGLDPASMDRYPHEFSGGQRQRIAIARAMALDPKFVVLDEPTSALDMSVQAQIVTLLRKLQAERGLAYLFISHDLKVVKALSNHLIVMKNGKVVESGTAEAIFANPQEAYTKELLAAAMRKDEAAGDVAA
jgi:microcin C transport system ATP-binding protein